MVFIVSILSETEQMKPINYFFALFWFWCFTSSCNQSDNGKISELENKVEQLEEQLDHRYKPGFGEFMSNIQVHHAKLWFAGKAENWELATFEMNEMREALDGIKTFNSDRSETEAIGMIDPALDSMKNAIQIRNTSAFERNYNLLTNTCNSCHQATGHAYNMITIPTTPPFSNQSFKTAH